MAKGNNMNERIMLEMLEMNARMKGMDYEDMTEFEREYAEMKDIEWALMDMHSVIEGGEAREDYETILASHQFTEIDDYIRHRLSLVREALKWHIQRKHLTNLLTGDEEMSEKKKNRVGLKKKLKFTEWQDTYAGLQVAWIKEEEE